MATWKDGKGLYTWGTYSNRGEHTKIYVVGGPGGGDSNYFYISNSDMDALRRRNYGTGVHFWWEGSTLKVTINLIILTARDDYQYLTGDKVRYVGNSSADYNFFADLQYQTKDGQWHKLGDHLVNTHYGGEPIYPTDGWDKGPGYLWNTFSFDRIDIDNVKQFSLGIHGDYDEVGNWVYYPIEQIKPTPPPAPPTPRQYTITTKYIERGTGRPLRGNNIGNGERGRRYRLEPVDIPGYTPEESSAEVYVNGDTEYTFYYNRIREYSNVTVEYYDTNGVKLRDDKVLRGKEVGSYVSETYIPIEGYSVDNPYKSITVSKYGNNVIRFTYSRNAVYIRPWAIRNSGSWKSFKTKNSNMKRRANSVFSNKSTEFNSSKAGETIPSYYLGNNSSVTQSSNYIRKSGSWKRQGKIGE